MWLSLLTLGVVLVCYADLRHRFRRTRRLLKEYHKNLVGEFDELHELSMLLQSVPLRGMLSPLRQYVIGSDFGRHLVDLIRERRPKMVVELGSGASTVLASYALEQNGEGQLLSFEESVEYAEPTRRRLREHGLDRLAEVRVAPIREGWYLLEEEPAGIDLLTVDGPADPELRYPVLNRLLPRMNPGGVVLIDDAEHPKVVGIVERWRAEHPELRFRSLPLRRGALQVEV